MRWLGISRSRNAGWYAAILCVVAAVVVTLLGHELGANACGIELVATFPSADGHTLTASRQMISGWLAMANNAPYYLLVAPVLLVVTHHFLLSCGEALAQLHAAGRIKASGALPWHETMARKNRWCVAPLCLLPVFLVICIHTQLSSVNRVMRGYPTDKKGWTEVGYVQSIALEGWCTAFNKVEKLDARIAILEACRFLPEVERGMVQTLEGRNASIASKLSGIVTYASGRPAAVRLSGADAKDMAAVAGSVTLEAKPLRPASDSWLDWRRYAKGAEHPWFPIWFKGFVILGQIVIAFFFTFAVWLMWKILFWLWQIFRMLPGPGRNDASLSFEPLLHDPTGRYGLSALFRPYNLLVLSATIGASYLALKLPSGISGSDIANAGGAGSGATALGHLVVILLVIVAVISGPMIVFPKKLRGWARKTRIDRLAYELSRATHKKHQAALLEEEAEINQQTTWPVGDSRFKVTIAILLAVLLLPLGSALQFLPGDAVSAIRLPQALRDSCQDFIAESYELKAP